MLLAPLAVGGGARTKLLEAMACGMPVVTSAAGAENMAVEPERDVLLAEGPAEFVAAVRRLHAEPGLVERLGRAGAAYVDGHAREASLTGALEEIYRGVSRQAAAVSAPASGRRALLLGVSPLPDDPEATALSFPGHRTAQLWDALVDGGFEVTAVLRDEDPGHVAAGRTAGRGGHLATAADFDSGAALARCPAARSSRSFRAAPMRAWHRRCPP